MQRRHFLAAAAQTALAASASTHSAHALAGAVDAPRALSASPEFASAACQDPNASFEAAARAGQQPWLAAFQSMPGDLATMPMQMRGRLPAGLRGHLWRNGPARHALGGERYRHWFDGDGAVHRYDLGINPQSRSAANTVWHQARFVQTGKFKAESQAGRLLNLTLATTPVRARAPRTIDEIGAANTHIVHHAGKALALWEAGPAMQLNPQDLSTLGPVAFSSATAGKPFSAHPRIEANGTMWNFGASGFTGELDIYRISADGRLAQHAQLPIPHMPMVHDFAVTQQHLVFLLPPLVFERERLADAGPGSVGGILGAYRWQPQLGMRALVLHKADLTRPRWFELPAGMVFHIGNACEQGGVIRLDLMRAPAAWQVLQGFQELMCGTHQPQEHTHLATVELDLASGKARQHVWPLLAEFPRVHPQLIGQPYRHVFAVARSGSSQRPGFDSVVRASVLSGKIDRYVYGEDLLVEEHVFVPSARSTAAPERLEPDGWVIGTALDLKHQRTLLSVFQGHDLAAGPVMQASMPRLVPLGFHGSFVSTA